MLTDRPRLSVVVPVFNSAGTLGDLVAELRRVLTELCAEWEIILVNDGSSDDSWARILELAGGDPSVHGLALHRNYGQHNALLAGIRSARHELIVTLDDDLQHPPEEIPRLVEHLQSGFDVVYGAPEAVRQKIWRRLAAWMTRTALRRAVGVENARYVSAFRVFRAGLREAFRSYDSPFVSIDVLLAWGTSRFGALTVSHHARRAGASTYDLGKLFRHAIDMTTGFSMLPLRLASLLGFVLTFFGLFVLAYVIISYLVRGGSAPGFPFLASVIAIFSGAQLFALGIFGEYLARIHFRSMNQPAYVIAESSPGHRSVKPNDRPGFSEPRG